MGTVIEFPAHPRQYTRVAFDQPVALIHRNSTVVTAQGANISQSGLQVITDRYTVDSLLRYEVPLNAKNAPQVDAHFRLASGGEMLKVDAHCRLVYVFDMDDGRHAMGLNFEDLDPASRENVLIFLSGGRQRSHL